MAVQGPSTQGRYAALPLLENPSRTLAFVRAIVAVVLAGFVIGYEPVEGTEPHALLAPAAAIPIAGMLGLSALQLWNRDWSQRRIDFVVGDAILMMGFLALYSFDPRKLLFPLLYVVIAEAAILLGLRPALITWLVTSVVYAIRELLASMFLDAASNPVSLFLRLIVGLALAALIGSLVNAVRAVRAFEHEREEVDRLRQIDEMKNAFLAAVSHDLKNPLTAILGFATTIRSRLDRLPPERTKEMVEHIVNSARRLQTMLDDLLDVDRMERGVLEPQLAATDMGDLVRRVVENVESRDHYLTVDLHELVARVDAAKVERIVENLVVNATKYTPAQSTVAVRLRANDGGVLIAVEDEGPGVPDDIKETIFERFQRAPDAGQRATGSGIGLSLVSQFAALHGGRAWVEDRPEGGASFRVFLPAEVAHHPND